MLNLQEIINKFNIPIKTILIEEGLIKNAKALLANLGFANKKILFVTDQILYPLLGEKIINNLEAETNLKKLILNDPRDDEKIANQIISQGGTCDLLVAAGSGTINDLCKLASSRLNIPYVIFASALSMNGYASPISSLKPLSAEAIKYKKSFPITLPLALFFDLDIIAEAPLRLTRAGIGDSLCFSTCQFDWLLSHLLLNTSYKPEAFELLKPYQQKVWQLPPQEKQLSNKGFLRLLAQILLVSGFGMYIAQGSHPASQGEHMLAHYLEMVAPEKLAQLYHGEQIAVTTVTMAKIQQKILDLKKLELKTLLLTESLPPDLLEEGKKALKAKAIEARRLEELNQKLTQSWPAIKEELRQVFISPSDLENLIRSFGLATKANEIGIEEAVYNQAINNAHLTRDRFTALDVYNQPGF